MKVNDKRYKSSINNGEIIKLYNNGLTIQKIGMKLNISDWTVRNRLVKAGITIRPNRKYFFDENTFKDIDSEWKAYFLGFMFADGCIRKDGNIAKISISKKDEEIIEYFAKKLGRDKIKITVDKPKKYKNRNNGEKINLLLCSKKLCSDLMNKGCTPQKSLTLDWPKNVPEHLINHFIRGYFDGDGSISKNGKSVSFNCSLLFAGKLQLFFKEKDISFKIYPHSSIVRGLIFRKNDVLKLKHIMYSIAEFALARKRERFQ